MSFHPRAGICEGVSADRPRPASRGPRSRVAGLASPDRRRANPSAISRALNPIAHEGARSDDVTPAVADRCTSLMLMRLLHSARILPAGLVRHLLIDARGNTRGAVAGIFRAGQRSHKSLPEYSLSGVGTFGTRAHLSACSGVSFTALPYCRVLGTSA